MFADTHCHLLDDRFDDTRQDIIGSFASDGVVFAVENGTCVNDSRKARILASENSCIYFTAGIHPESADECCRDSIGVIRELLKDPKAVAVGEIGLDYHYDFQPRDVQKKAFECMLTLAEETDMPVVIHSRDAAQDTFDMLKGAHVRGELHCYSGSREMAEQYLSMGYFFGFGGAVTFNNAARIAEVVKYIPEDRILTETDCPYMTPVPFRGQTNQPAYVKYVIEKIAGIKEMTAKETEDITLANAGRMFGIDHE